MYLLKNVVRDLEGFRAETTVKAELIPVLQ